MHTDKIYNKISEIVGALFVIGFAVDFAVRIGKIDHDYRFVSTVPFAVNVVLLLYALKILFTDDDVAAKTRKLLLTGIRLLLNIGILIVMIMVNK